MILLLLLLFSENLAGCDGCRLWSYRNVGPYWSRDPWLHSDGGGTASLDWHAGQPAQTDSTMAHAAGSTREELDTLRATLSSTARYIISRHLCMLLHRSTTHFRLHFVSKWYQIVQFHRLYFHILCSVIEIVFVGRLWPLGIQPERDFGTIFSIVLGKIKNFMLTKT